MVSYQLSAAADGDLSAIYRYGVLNFGLEQADEYFSGLFRCFEDIAAEPLRYPAVDDLRAGYRRCVYRVHSIYFRRTGDRVEIMRVLGRQDPTNAMGDGQS